MLYFDLIDCITSIVVYVVWKCFFFRLYTFPVDTLKSTSMSCNRQTDNLIVLRRCPDTCKRTKILTLIFTLSNITKHCVILYHEACTIPCLSPLPSGICPPMDK